MKRCCTCKVLLSESCFGKSTREPDGLKLSCKSCRKEESKKYYKENKLKIDEGNKARKISSWENFFKSLLYKDNRTELNVEDLLNLLEKQEGKCALTGVALTRDNKWTNASIDRIIPGGAYDLSNIRLVCLRANYIRHTMSDEELLYWCKKIYDWKA